MYVLSIKNMVCPRCIDAVEQSLSDAGLRQETVRLGEAVLQSPPEQAALEQLEADLRAKGFELIPPGDEQLGAQIKSEIIRFQQQIEAGAAPGLLSDWLSSKLNKNYSYLSGQFTQTSGHTITQFYEKLRTERAKELLALNRLSVGEIALTLGYSSSQHFSARFREQTGLSPTAWRQKGGERRSLDAI